MSIFMQPFVLTHALQQYEASIFASHYMKDNMVYANLVQDDRFLRPISTLEKQLQQVGFAEISMSD